MELYILLFITGILTGVLTILFGFGGGFVAVPLIYHCIRLQEPVQSLSYQLAFKSAIASSLLLMIFNAGLASYQQARQAKIQWQYVFPLCYWVGLGACCGTLLSLYLSATMLKWGFFIYVALTLLDCARRVYLDASVDRQHWRLKPRQQRLAGIMIGTVAAALGVGGSVLTVPLFRRCGLEMSAAVALANPLSLPVALVGASTFVVAYLLTPIDLGQHFIGYFYYPALGCLLLGGYLGMQLTRPLANRLNNRHHEIGYMLLLSGVLISILYR